MKILINKNILLIVLSHLLMWSIVWLFFKYYYSFNSENQPYIKWFALILMPITMANTYINIYYLIPQYLLKKKHFLFVLYEVYLLIGTAYVLSILMFFGYVYLSDFNFDLMPPLSASMPFILISIYLVVLIVSGFKLFQYNFKNLEKNKTLENQFLEAQLKLKEEELKYLKMQIHPHFLFNTLNTLYGFALKQSKQTPELVLKLSSLLDYILYQTDKPTVLLSEEVNHIQDYIGLEQIRFSDTLNVHFNKNIEDDHLMVAPMLLLPFVENAFKHGSLIEDKLSININVHSDSKALEFIITNSCKNEKSKTEGIGLENVKKRLDLLYPNQYELGIQQQQTEFIVHLKIDLHG